eukprot:SAG11_NODE_154_length_14340_cov_19.803946_3_plen_455_part_00
MSEGDAANPSRVTRRGRSAARDSRGEVAGSARAPPADLLGLTDAELASRLGDANVLESLGLDPEFAERLARFGGRAQDLAEENSALRAAVDEGQPSAEGEVEPAIRAVAEGVIDLAAVSEGDGPSGGGEGGAASVEARATFEATRRRQVAFAEAEAAEDQTLVAGVVRGRGPARGGAGASGSAAAEGGGGGDYWGEDYAEWESRGGGGYGDWQDEPDERALSGVPYHPGYKRPSRIRDLATVGLNEAVDLWRKGEYRCIDCFDYLTTAAQYELEYTAPIAGRLYDLRMYAERLNAKSRGKVQRIPAEFVDELERCFDLLDERVQGQRERARAAAGESTEGFTPDDALGIMLEVRDARMESGQFTGKFGEAKKTFATRVRAAKARQRAAAAAAGSRGGRKRWTYSEPAASTEEWQEQGGGSDGAVGGARGGGKAKRGGKGKPGGRPRGRGRGGGR